jgi:hypothetical protein
MTDDDDRVDDSTLQRGEPGSSQARQHGRGGSKSGRRRVKTAPSRRKLLAEPESCRLNVKLSTWHRKVLESYAFAHRLRPEQLLERELRAVKANERPLLPFADLGLTSITQTALAGGRQRYNKRGSERRSNTYFTISKRFRDELDEAAGSLGIDRSLIVANLVLNLANVIRLEPLPPGVDAAAFPWTIRTTWEAKIKANPPFVGRANSPALTSAAGCE